VIGAVVIVLIAGGVWRIFLHERAPKIDPASVEKMAFPLPAKPSIAVLPFTNMSGDPEQEYFSDGTAEDLITDLSKLHGLMVIARNSSFAYKGKAVPIKQIAEELGVKYLLKGSVRKAEKQVRINAQLIDATTGQHLWAERYDRNLKDIFTLQDEVTEKIVEALALKLIPPEKERLIQRETNSLEAYDLVLRAWAYFRQFSRETNSQAKKMFEKAIELDPSYAVAYVGLVWAKMIELQLGWNRDPMVMEEAFALAQKSVALNEASPKAHVLLGNVHLWRKQHDEAIAEFEKAIALDPNDADALQALASALNFVGKPDEAIGLLKKAMRLNPHYPEWYVFNLGRAYFQAGLYDKAIPALEEAILKNPNLPPIQYYLAASYGHLGKQTEARERAEEIKTLRPNFLSEIEKEKDFYKYEENSQRLVMGLRKAGLI
jgi:adenylate cyclase